MVVYSPDFQCYHARLSAPGSWAGVSCFVRVCVCGDVFIFVFFFFFFFFLYVLFVGANRVNA